MVWKDVSPVQGQSLARLSRLGGINFAIGSGQTSPGIFVFLKTVGFRLAPVSDEALKKCRIIEAVCRIRVEPEINCLSPDTTNGVGRCVVNRVDQRQGDHELRLGMERGRSHEKCSGRYCEEGKENG